MIGLMGAKGSGKDTVAKILATMGYERVAFADEVRAQLLILNPIVGWDEESERTAYLKDVIAEFGWDYAKEQIEEVRRLMQIYATEVVRNHYGDDAWLRQGMQKAVKVIEAGAMPVFTDCRFPNEHAAIRASGGQIWRIIRPGEGQTRAQTVQAAQEATTHESEHWWARLPADHEIWNDGSLEQLFELVMTFETVRQGVRKLKL